ncbi:hypothetical protein C8R47DRAFT_1104367 [Mycena vitilis]|nr:hypothetical protein C8R47DRAFT_1104367 [Mycena vitilis]
MASYSSPTSVQSLVLPLSLFCKTATGNAGPVPCFVWANLQHSNDPRAFLESRLSSPTSFKNIAYRRLRMLYDTVGFY